MRRLLDGYSGSAVDVGGPAALGDRDSAAIGASAKKSKKHGFEPMTPDILEQQGSALADQWQAKSSSVPPSK